jgi:hypothetical protein
MIFGGTIRLMQSSTTSPITKTASKYEEMCEAAGTARRLREERHNRCLGYLCRIVSGLIQHCEIPEEQIAYSRWDGKGNTYQRAEEGMKYTVPGAAVLDEEDDYWRLGIRITLTPAGFWLSHIVFAVLCVSEEGRMPLVKISPRGKPRQLDLDDPNQCREFFDGIVETIKKGLLDPRKAMSSQIGFVISTERSESSVPSTA